MYEYTSTIPGDASEEGVSGGRERPGRAERRPGRRGRGRALFAPDSGSGSGSAGRSGARARRPPRRRAADTRRRGAPPNAGPRRARAAARRGAARRSGRGARSGRARSTGCRRRAAPDSRSRTARWPPADTTGTQFDSPIRGERRVQTVRVQRQRLKSFSAKEHKVLHAATKSIVFDDQ